MICRFCEQRGRGGDRLIRNGIRNLGRLYQVEEYQETQPDTIYGVCVPPPETRDAPSEWTATEPTSANTQSTDALRVKS